ncbi:hypothetical protein AKJ09_06062 [Labilithrix luteola]|uniref:Uncharacterized protein n=1 Tax=Labilithrix luteola TaxID=1391654 RepID=A0A0K1Q0T7_9BACT|nr:hypothetical protein [Labilithrix luteola]AKU99398.1 hypothetical protein AKJ09_06062 [Labilithrix luteola]
MSDAAKREQETSENSTAAEVEKIEKRESAMPPPPQSGTRPAGAVRGTPLSVLWFEDEVDEAEAGGKTTG